MKERSSFVTAVFFFLSAFLFLVPSATHAASLQFSPAIISRAVGETFSLTVFVESPRQAMNAASGMILFPPDKLEILRLSKAHSIMSLWAQEPTFSNTQGTFSFEGIALTPGYTGTYGVLVEITFQAKSAGEAEIRFESGALLANDGKGSNILDTLGSARLSITDENSAVPKKPLVNAPVSNAPVLASPTHPDHTTWYAHAAPTFTWELPANAQEVRTAISPSAHTVPTVSHAEPITEKTVDPLSDGTHYFLVQIRTPRGWSEIGRYQVNIDTTPPDPFTLTFPLGKKSLDPRPVVVFDTIDKESGISHNEVKIDNAEPERVSPQPEPNWYPIPPQDPGVHTIIVTAVDEAGNTRSVSEDFTVDAIDTPMITYYSENTESGDAIQIRGSTYPNADVDIIVKDKDTTVFTEHLRSDNTGAFTAILKKYLAADVYTFTARVSNDRGERSNETGPLTIVVRAPFLISIIGTVLNYLSLVILILLILGGLWTVGIHIKAHWSSTILLPQKPTPLPHTVRMPPPVMEDILTPLREHIRNEFIQRVGSKSKRGLTKKQKEFLAELEKVFTSTRKDIITKPSRKS